MIEGIQRAAELHKGDQKLMLEVADGDDVYRIGADRRYGIRVCDGLLDELALIVGPEQLSFVRR